MRSDITSQGPDASASPWSRLDMMAVLDECEGTILDDPTVLQHLIAAVQVLDAPPYAAEDQQDSVERLNDAMLNALGAIERALEIFAPNLVASRMASHRPG